MLVGNIGTQINVGHSPGATPSYILLNGEDYFSLNIDSGDLYTKRRFNREALCPHETLNVCTMQVDAIISSDHYSEFVKLKILILDVNDNAPYFPEKYIVVHVPEDTEVGSRFVVDHTATDLDIQENAALQYHLENSGGVFSLDQGTATLLVVLENSVDREFQSSYQMMLIATDGGMLPLSGSAVLTIHIDDVNDHCPAFASKEIVVNVPKNASMNSIVVQLLATDEDYGEHAEIHYTYSNRVLETSQKLFHLNSKTGIITLSSLIDDEATPQHKLTVLATGLGCAPAVVFISINIYQVVTRAPKLELRFIAEQKDEAVYLREDYPLNAVFAILEVIDPDHTVLEPCYISGETPFYLKPYDKSQNMYGVAVAKDLDYEREKYYNVTIIAKDGFVRNLLHQITLRVNIEDVNDNDPQFTLSLFETSIRENNEPGAFVIKVSAADADGGQSGGISYHLGEKAPSVFALDSSSGILTARADLDRERDARYTFLVIAVDQGVPPRSSTCTVVINVLDENDNAPLLQTDITFFIPEDFPGFGEVGVINVTDVDAGQNGEILIAILNATAMFMMNGTRVILNQNASVDYEKEQTYIFWVNASDRGYPPQSSTAKVAVFILDTNDNFPIIVLPESNFSYVLVLPNASRGSAIAKVHAIDYDDGLNGDVSYSMLNAGVPTSDLFGVETATGNIILEKEIQSIHCGLYQLLVKASDHGHPMPLYSIVQINIILNSSISNRSYFESLIMAQTNFSDKGHPIKLSPCPHTPPASLFALHITVPAAVGVTTVSSVFCICGFFMFFHARKRSSQRNNKKIDIELPLRINREYPSKDWNDVQ
ncbi:protocadherin-20-like [Pleurodeles waltl]